MPQKDPGKIIQHNFFLYSSVKAHVWFASYEDVNSVMKKNAGNKHCVCKGEMCMVREENHHSIDKKQYYCTTEQIDHTVSVSWAPNYVETIQNPLSPSSPSPQRPYLTASKF